MGQQTVKIRVQLLNREGKALFKVPMLLITNKEVNTPDQASIVYSVYLKRSKIEGVFKFLKNVLGWEESQIRRKSHTILYITRPE